MCNNSDQLLQNVHAQRKFVYVEMTYAVVYHHARTLGMNRKYLMPRFLDADSIGRAPFDESLDENPALTRKQRNI